MSEQTCDVVIAGGGLIGSALGALLARRGCAVTLAEQQQPDALLNPAFDGRVSAVSYSSVLALQAAGVWPRLLPVAQPIERIVVCEGDAPVHLSFTRDDVGGRLPGYLIENRHIRRALFETLRDTPNLTLKTGCEVRAVHSGPGRATAAFSDGTAASAPLVVACDGRGSRLREAAGIGVKRLTYGQTAIVCIIDHEQDHGGMALERFFPAGPFAVLPMQGRRSGIVWTEKDDDARQYLALPDDEFAFEIGRRIGGYLGTVSPAPGRWSYPLSLQIAERAYAGRLLLVGDSAHAIHPIAGQGANLGWRDVAALADLVAERRRLGLDLGAEDLMEAYARWRRLDVIAMAGATDLLDRLFSNDFFPLKVARNAGLSAVNRMPRLKSLFMKHAMGMLGRLPQSLRAGNF